MLAAADVDLALSSSVSVSDKNDLFDEAEDRIATMLDIGGLTLGKIIDAQILQAYIPAFEARTSQEELNDDEVEDLELDVADLIGGVIQAPIHEINVMELCKLDHGACLHSQKQRQHTLAKLGLHGLLLRDDIMLYPAVPREQSPFLKPARQYSHHAYTLDDGLKTPIRIVDEQSDDFVPEVLPLPYARSLHALGINMETSQSDQAPHAELKAYSTWLQDDLLGHEIQPHQLAFLDGATDEVVLQADRHFDSLYPTSD